VRNPVTFSDIVEETGLSWTPDFGSWSPPKVWDPCARMEAEHFSSQGGASGVVDLGSRIGYVSHGDYTVYDSVAFGSGVADFEACAASGGIGGYLEIRADSLAGSLAGRLRILPTGGWNAWKTLSCPVSGLMGDRRLFLKFTGGPSDLFDLDWFRFTPLPEAVRPRPGGDGPPFTARLCQNFPNPFNASTVIRYVLETAGPASLSLYDLEGREIIRLFSGHQGEGEHEVRWEAEGLPSGLYFCRLNVGGFSETMKLILQN
jgi:hypothetical protein